MSDEGESDFAFVVKFVGAFQRHNDENVELVFEHALRDVLIDAEILDETQTCTMDIGVVSRHHFADGGELLLDVHPVNQLRIRLELLELEYKAMRSYRHHVVRDLNDAIKTSIGHRIHQVFLNLLLIPRFHVYIFHNGILPKSANASQSFRLVVLLVGELTELFVLVHLRQWQLRIQI